MVTVYFNSIDVMFELHCKCAFITRRICLDLYHTFLSDPHSRPIGLRRTYFHCLRNLTSPSISPYLLFFQNAQLNALVSKSTGMLVSPGDRQEIELRLKFSILSAIEDPNVISKAFNQLAVG